MLDEIDAIKSLPPFKTFSCCVMRLDDRKSTTTNSRKCISA